MAEPLWRFDELIAAAGGVAEGEPAGAITGFSIDTRTLRPGEVFVALKDQRDGHEFVSAAFAAGAAAALVAREYARRPGDGPLIRVADTLEGLRAIGRAARNRLSPKARVIAVTGSAGKTGTKEMLRASLATCGKVHAPEKSFNNHWGVPLTLARMPADVDFAVFEIGMNHAGEIGPLTRLVRPHIAIITNVLPVHIGNFEDGEEGVARAKAEIFEGLEAPPSLSPCPALAWGEGRGEGPQATREGPQATREGQPEDGVRPMGLTPSQEQPRPTAIIPRDSPHFELLKAKAEDAHARTRTFKGTDADARLPEVRFGADARGPYSVIKAAIGGRPVPTYRLGMTGQHLAENSLAVLLALDTIGLDLEVTTRGLADLSAPSGRGAQTRFDTEDSPLLLIDEAYNANPASMARAIDTAAMVAGNDSTYRRLVLVLGDMLELGENASEFHLALKEAIAWRPDLVFACGPNMKLLWDSLPAEMRTPGGWQPTSAGLVEVVPAALRPGDVVMVKGSLGSRMAPIVEAIKMRFARSGD